MHDKMMQPPWSFAGLIAGSAGASVRILKMLDGGYHKSRVCSGMLTIAFYRYRHILLQLGLLPLASSRAGDQGQNDTARLYKHGMKPAVRARWTHR